MSKNHRIRSIRWKGRTDSTTEGFRLRELLRHEGNDFFLAIAHEAFDEATRDGRILHVPRLEIRMKIDNTCGFSADVKDSLLMQLRNQLRRAPAGISGDEEPRPEQLRMSRREALLHYLQTGSLPWHAVGHASGDAAELSATAVSMLDDVIEELATPGNPADTVGWLRLLQLLPERESAVYLATLFAPLPLATFAVLPFLTSLLDKRPESFPRPLALRVAACVSAAVRSGGTVFTAIAQELTATELQNFRELLADLPVEAQQSFDDATAAESGAATSPACRTGRGPADAAEDLTAPPSAPRRNLPPSTVNPFEKPVSAARDMPRPAPATPPGLFPLFIENAGVVLVVPFLSRFLANCGVAAADAHELPPEELTRTAALIHYLVTGEQEVFEFQLPLVKILLGLQPTAPLPVTEGLLGKRDIIEADMLLRSVIAHWEALKGTSVQGLRTTFLRRQGLLRGHEEGWRLTVERTGFDVLLERLPWAIGIAKLPWMPKPVFVEW